MITSNKKNNSLPFYSFLLIFLLLSLGSLCTGSPVLSDLINSRMTLKLVGTYETEAVRPWQNVYLDNNLVRESVNKDILLSSMSQEDLKKYLDVGEIRISKGDINQNFFELNQEGNVDDFWEYFVRERQVYCSNYYSTDDEDTDSCEKLNGKAKLKKILSGEGVSYPVNDISEGEYTHLGIFFRRMVFAHAYQEYANGNIYKLTSPFDTFTIDGVDYMKYAQYLPDEDHETTYPRMVPLMYRTKKDRIRDLKIDDSDEPYVLEVRMFLRNLFMQHRVDILDSSNNILLSEIYVGLSDWRRDHNTAGSLDLQAAIEDDNGGNFILRARAYYPGRVGTVKVKDSVGALSIDYNTNPQGVSPAQWLLLEYSDVTLSDIRAKRSRMPYAASFTEGADDITFHNIMPGSYKLYRSCDLVSSAPHNSISSYPRITVNDDNDKLSSQGGRLDLTLFGTTISDIIFSGDTADDAAVNLRAILRSLPFAAIFTVSANVITIKPDDKFYYIQNDFSNLAGSQSSLLSISNGINVAVSNSLSAKNLHGGPDGFPEEIRLCTKESFTVSKGKTITLPELSGSDCVCDGTAY